MESKHMLKHAIIETPQDASTAQLVLATIVPLTFTANLFAKLVVGMASKQMLRHVIMETLLAVLQTAK